MSIIYNNDKTLFNNNMNNKDNKELAIDNKRLYYLLLTLPFILIIGLIVSIYYVPAI